MRHHDTAMILATGGAAMVRAAYSSGTPAIGVGPGNGPAYIERTADLKAAVKRILDSKTFDNGTICSSEQSVICDDDMVETVRSEMTSQGAYFLNDEEREKLGGFILRCDGSMNPQIVGRDVSVIADLAEINVPQGTRVLVAKETGVGRGHPFSNEKLAPILAFFSAANYEKVCDMCCEILHYEGAGHTFSIHTQNGKMVKYFAERVPASRIVVNTLSALGGIGASTGLMPSLTLGCGAEGGSATSDNVGPMNLLNKRFIAAGKLEIEAIRDSARRSIDGSCSLDVSDIDVSAIVKKILEKVNAA